MPRTVTPQTSAGSDPGDCQDELSERYTEYIEIRKEALVSKCQQLTDCVDKLLEDENVLVLLKGETLNLNKTCGLIYKEGPHVGAQAGKCKPEDRDDIRDDLEQNLSSQLEDKGASGWKNIRNCLTNSYGDKDHSSYVTKICGLAQRQTQICDSPSIHRTVKNFFNNQIQHLRCVCRNLQNDEEGHSKQNVPAIIGGIAGGLFLLFLISALCFFIYRKQKSRRSKKRTPNVIYLPAPNAENYPVYQDICDDKAYQRFGISSSGNPPNLPVRYTSHPVSRQEDEPAYLEPVEAGLRLRPKLPFPGQSNPNYGAPPEYSEVDTQDRNQETDRTNIDNGYFEPLPTPPEENSFNKADKSGLGPNNPASTYEAVEVGSSTKPVPAKRSKNEGQRESSRFLLDHDGSLKRQDSTV